jgi:hypothetical protein
MAWKERYVESGFSRTYGGATSARQGPAKARLKPDTTYLGDQTQW